MAAALLADDVQAQGEARITLADALAWARHNKVEFGDDSARTAAVLGRINAARQAMQLTPFRLVAARASHDPLPPPSYGGGSDPKDQYRKPSAAQVAA